MGGVLDTIIAICREPCTVEQLLAIIIFELVVLAVLIVTSDKW